MSRPPGWLGMTQLSILNRPGMTAIAAFAALSSTPLLAQAADPLAPATDTAPAITSTPPVTATPSDPVVIADPLAPSAAATAKAKPVAVKPTRTTTMRTSTRTVTATAKPVRAAAPIAAAAPVASVPAPIQVVPPMAAPTPLPPETPVATAPVAPPVDQSILPADALPIAGAGLGALALAAAALAMRRRRRLNDEREELRYDEPAFVATAAPVEPEPAYQPEPARTDAPIMAWAAPAASAAPVATHPLVDGEVPPGIDPQSHAAAAYRGPSADNPSLSLQKRLKRAAFFDQREKLVAAGMATPIARDAGLPEAMEVPEAPRADPVPATAPRPLTSGGNFSYKPAFHPA